jgi:DNA topoisomerase-2
MSGIDDDTYALMMKRVYDIAGTVRDVKVFMNGERLKVKNFKQVSYRSRTMSWWQYVEMYLNASTQAAADAAGGATIAKPAIIYEVVNKRWEVAFALSDGQTSHVSFANSISTIKGGTHVDMITTQLANKL